MNQHTERERWFRRAAALHERGVERMEAGDLRVARRDLLRAVHFMVLARGRQHPEVANLLGTLASAERTVGCVATAERLGRRALAIVGPLRAGGDLPRLRVQLLAGLAETVCARGRYAEARALLRRALAVARRRLGTHDLDTMAVLNLLGMVGKYSGRLDDAARAYQAAWHIAVRHPDADLATLCHNRGGLEHARGRYARAEAFARRALELRRRTLPSDHPQVALEAAALAPILHARGRLDEAERLLRDALATFGRAFGDESYDVAVGSHNLAAVLADSGAHGEAERLYRRALDLKTRLLGARHPDTELTRRMLSALLEQVAKRDRVSGERGRFRTKGVAGIAAARPGGRARVVRDRFTGR